MRSLVFSGVNNLRSLPLCCIDKIHSSTFCFVNSILLSQTGLFSCVISSTIPCSISGTIYCTIPCSISGTIYCTIPFTTSCIIPCIISFYTISFSISFSSDVARPAVYQIPPLLLPSTTWLLRVYVLAYVLMFGLAYVLGIRRDYADVAMSDK